MSEKLEDNSVDRHRSIKKLNDKTAVIGIYGLGYVGLPLMLRFAAVGFKVIEGLNQSRKSLNGSRILILGIAYKKNVDDIRESPAAEIMEILRDHGAEIAYHDPFIPVFPAMRQYDFDLQNVELTPTTLRDHDCMLLVTDHDELDYALIREHAALIVDTRGRFQKPEKHIIRA
jgi:UDP-N-acetyl-D-glucosamine dehydrogenase